MKPSTQNSRRLSWPRGLRRCLLALPVAQEFRILQKVNDLRVTTRDRRDAPLSANERKRLLTALRREGDLKWKRVKKILELDTNAKFSIQYLEDEEDGLVGHRTNAKLADKSIFGERWFTLPETEQDAIVLDVVHFRNPDALVAHAQKTLGPPRSGSRETAQTETIDML
ncbi:MAG: hypothetical protein QM811_31945 [Pirellulales bacterium]